MYKKQKKIISCTCTKTTVKVILFNTLVIHIIMLSNKMYFPIFLNDRKFCIVKKEFLIHHAC